MTTDVKYKSAQRFHELVHKEALGEITATELAKLERYARLRYNMSRTQEDRCREARFAYKYRLLRKNEAVGRILYRLWQRDRVMQDVCSDLLFNPPPESTIRTRVEP